MLSLQYACGFKLRTPATSKIHPHALTKKFFLPVSSSLFPFSLFLASSISFISLYLFVSLSISFFLSLSLSFTLSLSLSSLSLSLSFFLQFVAVAEHTFSRRPSSSLYGCHAQNLRTPSYQAPPWSPKRTALCILCCGLLGRLVIRDAWTDWTDKFSYSKDMSSLIAMYCNNDKQNIIFDGWTDGFVFRFSHFWSLLLSVWAWNLEEGWESTSVHIQWLLLRDLHTESRWEGSACGIHCPAQLTPLDCWEVRQYNSTSKAGCNTHCALDVWSAVLCAQYEKKRGKFWFALRR